MSPYAGTRQDVHYERKRAWAEEFFASDECIRENNGLLSELGSNHLLGSGVGTGYTVRDVNKSKRWHPRVATRPWFGGMRQKDLMKKKILIVEDNSDSREILGLFVTKFGCQPIKACNSKEALTYAEAERPDLIFMDMDLPDADGIKTTALLKRNPKTSHIPVVALTAWLSELWREKALKVGIVDYQLKPVSPQTLKQTIEKYTNGAVTSLKFGASY